MLRESAHLAWLTLRAAGIDTLVANSAWGQNRLLIHCWHGISLDDEHLWCPSRPSTSRRNQFRRRLSLLRDNGYTVFALDEALERLWHGDLPPRRVAITFECGAYDFLSLAAPVMAEFGFGRPLHVCYPSGVFRHEYFPLLEQEDLRSATRAGFWSRSAIEIGSYVDDENGSSGVAGGSFSCGPFLGCGSGHPEPGSEKL